MREKGGLKGSFIWKLNCRSVESVMQNFPGMEYRLRIAKCVDILVNRMAPCSI